MNFPDLVQPIIQRRDLAPEQAEAVMDFLIGGEATDAQIGAILLGLRIKGCTTRELASFIRVLRARAATLEHTHEDLVDTCGTGGGTPSFNISTAAAIVAAAAGVHIAKHGNRAVTSRCGSADVLEALGVRIGSDPEQLLHMLDTIRIVFLFAPAHHSTMRRVAAARRELGVRTVFNQLGPLVNPAGARRQLIGVYDPGLMRSMGEALKELGTERAFLVHGLDGLDEISPCGPTEVVRIWDGRIGTLTIRPEDFGLAAIDPSALTSGETPQENADILREAITDVDSPRAAAILPNSAAAIMLAGIADDLRDGAEIARETIKSGRAAKKLEDLITASQGEL